jgi:hypothetical protein
MEAPSALEQIIQNHLEAHTQCIPKAAFCRVFYAFGLPQNRDYRHMLCTRNGLRDGGKTMEQLHMPNPDVVTQIQQMLDTPIEDQAATFELALLGNVLQNTLEMLRGVENNDEASEILRSMIKSAFVIGRRHFNQLV